MSRDSIHISGAETHRALMSIAKVVLEEFVNSDGLSDEEALAILYMTNLTAELIEELHDTDKGASAVSKALQKLSEFGIAEFALKHGTIVELEKGNLH